MHSPSPDQDKVAHDLLDIIWQLVDGKRVELLQHIQDARALADERAGLGLLEPGTISLVETATGEIAFVRWTDPARMLARRLKLDHLDRIITIVAFRVPVNSYEGCRFSIKDTSAVMLQCMPHERPTMHSWCLLFEKEAKLQQFTGLF